ncbi:NAD-dependent DNA ligase [Bacillus sp. AFS077874]|uniref:BRCT domain-containing protein n=1 Tax=Bacillus sp. AFS077874 TaxID=2033513 RepID=UPI000BF27C66|nr:BRCT domain-containing protein [Bacillus sp. AFS077874]PFM75230.1 NAD-dependent DNA ligase [Bacillus sp. AFS077874]
MTHFKEVNEYRSFTSKSEIHRSVNSLIGIISGMEFDGKINEDELSELINWCNLHRHLQSKPPFSEIIPLIDLSLNDNILELDEINDILWLCNQVNKDEDFIEFYDLTTSSIQQLEGIFHGMLADNELSDIEIIQLKKWMDDRRFLKSSYPFDEITSLLVSVLEDGIITVDEKNTLKAFFGNFIDTKQSYNINEYDIKALQSKYSIEGICATEPEISFEGKLFCFTGTSYKAKRNEIANLITDKGGLFNNNVLKKTDFLIIGGEGNPCWAYSCYGRKVEKAVQLRKEGSNVLIVHENDFWKLIG